ncbi:MAG: DUF2125 domain-containing protein [Paracoccaceae bacterium]
MKQLSGRGAAALAVFLLGSTAVHADITAEEVWQQLSDYYADLGHDVTAGSKGMEGDTLIVRDAVFASDMPDASVTFSIAELRMKELGDGRVEITMSEELPVTMKSSPATGEDVDMSMSITQSDLKMIASGSVADTSYEFTAPKLGIAFDGMMVDGKPVPMKFNASMEGNSGTTRITTGATRAIDSQMASDKVDFSMAADDPEGQGNFVMSGSLTGLTGTTKSSFAEGIDMQDLSKALQAGTALEGTFAYTGGGYTFDFKDGEESVTGQSTAEGGSLNFAMSKDGLTYGGEGKAATVSMQVSAFPMPIDMKIAESAFNLTMPVTKSDDEQPFGLLVKMVGLEVSDGIWGLFDPTSQLPRDPATMIVDVSGGAKLLVDFLDPENAKALEDTVPGEVTKLDINELKVSAVGADLTGTGAMTFDNSAGTPKPIGSINLQLVGGNALIDKLVAMGFVPEDQAMGARMMLGMFAVPSGDDTLTSEIEFKEDGGIYANGQRIQ